MYYPCEGRGMNGSGGTTTAGNEIVIYQRLYVSGKMKHLVLHKRWFLYIDKKGEHYEKYCSSTIGSFYSSYHELQ